ncbi:MAG: hypothetical protein DMG03_11895 [Acidobacteria bacterium]|nr:MAG: hypothetical protein DMG03_11895 [Acidobacteriota bacterium]
MPDGRSSRRRTGFRRCPARRARRGRASSGAPRVRPTGSRRFDRYAPSFARRRRAPGPPSATTSAARSARDSERADARAEETRASRRCRSASRRVSTSTR